MNGIEFYETLRAKYSNCGQQLYGNFTFYDWLYKPKNGTFSFRFKTINNDPKAIPRNIITAAWEANREINDDWIKENNSNKGFHKDCRLYVLNFLINEYRNLRQ